MRTLATALAFLALGATPALAKQPVASSLDKVLVIGTDGTRWDLLRDAMRDGRAPNLARLARQGFARPSKLDYGPNVLTLSEVGWSSIASGVWPDKHGVDGRKFNMDPKQATKNGYLDFLTRVERGKPRLETYLAADWANLGLPENGGPIFGPTDERFATRVAEERLELWDAGDVQVTNAARSYLRTGVPDASFVYFGLVDEAAHLAGSATPTYRQSITTTDARIGQILRAVRRRPTYRFESWTIIVTTDHGQRTLDEPSLATHLSQTPLEITSFLIGAGPGLGKGEAAEGRGYRADRPPPARAAGTEAWKLDGRPLSRSGGSLVSASARKGRLRVTLRLAQPRAARGRVRGAPARGVRVTSAASLDAHVNGRPVGGSLKGGRTIVVGVPGRRLRSLWLTGAVTGSGGNGRTVKLSRRARRPRAELGREVGRLGPSNRPPARPYPLHAQTSQPRTGSARPCRSRTPGRRVRAGRPRRRHEDREGRRRLLQEVQDHDPERRHREVALGRGPATRRDRHEGPEEVPLEDEEVRHLLEEAAQARHLQVHLHRPPAGHEGQDRRRVGAKPRALNLPQ